jgi:transcriptional repressor NrdR
MQCPFCGVDKDKVIDSRSSEGGRVIRRRRHCLECGRRFTTYERPEEAIRVKVVKKDGTSEAYDRTKIVSSLQRACYKRRIDDEKLLAIVEAIEELILQRFDKEVPSRTLGEMVIERLRSLDKIAYVRYASVYRDFKDVGELIEDARQVEHVPGEDPRQRGLFDSAAAGPERPEPTDQEPS